MKKQMEQVKSEWKTEYFNSIMAEDYNKALDIKKDHFPRSLYKYRSLTQQTIDCIKSDTLWAANISSLNDPFECSLKFDHDECFRTYFASGVFIEDFRKKFGKELSEPELHELQNNNIPFETFKHICESKNIEILISSEDFLRDIQKSWHTILEESNSDIKICCFSELNDSTTMWSHYSSEHKGICIEYDLLVSQEIRTFLHPVIYADNVPSIGLWEDLTILRKIGSTLVKSKDWSYEHEWRFTRFKMKNGEFPDAVNVPTPKAVYLGTRFDMNLDPEKDRLLRVLEERNIPVYQMTRNLFDYKLQSNKPIY